MPHIRRTSSGKLTEHPADLLQPLKGHALLQGGRSGYIIVQRQHHHGAAGKGGTDLSAQQDGRGDPAHAHGAGVDVSAAETLRRPRAAPRRNGRSRAICRTWCKTAPARTAALPERPHCPPDPADGRAPRRRKKTLAPSPAPDAYPADPFRNRCVFSWLSTRFT